MPILGIGVTSREYTRPPSKTKDSFWIEACPPYSDTVGDPRLVGKWVIYVALRKLDESWEKIRKSTVESRMGFLSKSSTAKKNFAPNVVPNRMIMVYTHDY
ncbi:MAG TPA: putative phosphothreonine lyase domain-containing protein, partial [Nitrososphaerales archaeon]|nr:putative phosphothreonine lyase domain-containing protein [Nitrososphaerales archaeon]